MLEERFLERPAFETVEFDRTLPNVLLIGDSISIGYTPMVREQLKGIANVYRIPENGGDTKKGLCKLESWLGRGVWDVVHFNWGLHDLKYTKEGKLDLSGNQVNPIQQYETNLIQLVQRLKKTKAKLIWASTTPIPTGAEGRHSGEELNYNAVAKGIMDQFKISLNDLHETIHPHLNEVQRPANVHFFPEGSRILGKRVAEIVAAHIEK